jgi:glycine oxidase
MEHTVIVIVGGGVMGCTLLYTLARRGERVTLVERGRIGEPGASGVPVALLNPYRGRSARASAFDLEALEQMWALVTELEAKGLTTGVRRSAVLRLASNAKQAKTWRKRDGVRWLEPEEVAPAYHAPFGGFLVPQGGFLEPRVWLRALVEAAKNHGATVIEGCEVQRISADSDLEITLETSVGLHKANCVVLCSGHATGLGQEELRLEAVAGEVVELEHPDPLPYPLAGAVYGAALGSSFFLGGNHRPALTDDAQAPVQLRRAGGWFIPSLREAQILSVWHGVRAKTADNFPLVRELEPGLWFAGALAGRGFLCAAAVAETLAARLVRE